MFISLAGLCVYPEGATLKTTDVNTQSHEQYMYTINGGVNVCSNGFQQIACFRNTSISKWLHNHLALNVGIFWNSTTKDLVFVIVVLDNACNGSNLNNGNHAGNTEYQSFNGINSLRWDNYTTCQKQPKIVWRYNRRMHMWVQEVCCEKTPIYHSQLTIHKTDANIVLFSPEFCTRYYLGSTTKSSTIDLGINNGGVSFGWSQSSSATSSNYLYCIEAHHIMCNPTDSASWIMNTGKTGMTFAEIVTAFGIQLLNASEYQHTVSFSAITNNTYYQGTTWYLMPWLHTCSFESNLSYTIPKLK